ncbi:MAG: T9SS type A sorting domain-containing protein [bacterium]
MQYFAGGAPPFYYWHAHSLDGINFVQQPNYFADRMNIQIFPNPCKNKIEIIVHSVNTTNQQDFSKLSIKIFDITGVLVRSWDNITIGEYNRIFWYGDNKYGKSVNPGIYFIVLENCGEKRVKKVILIR